MILHGFPVKEKIKEVLIERIKKLEKKSFLAIVQVGDRADSNVYVRQKQKFGEEIGVKVLINKFDVDIKEEDLTREIKKLNEDESVNGIIVQLPLPEHIDTQKIINLISPQKDVDHLSSSSQAQKCTDIFLLKNSSCSPQSGSQGISELVAPKTFV